MLNRALRPHLYVLLACLLLIIGLLLWGVPPTLAYLVWLIAWSLIAFVYYAYDKRQAGQRGWRVPESILLTLSLVGGFVGSGLAIYLLRHKTRHFIFVLVLLLSLLLHGGLVYAGLLALPLVPVSR
jgi:uncharacterized membrane protein YsdA (DUF1294 family)